MDFCNTMEFPIAILWNFNLQLWGCGRKPGLKIRVRRRYSHVFI
jgi:hypothetical protein